MHTTPTDNRIQYGAVLPACLAALYLALTIAVVVGSPLDDLDRHIAALNLRHHYPTLRHWVSWFVVIGQRGPSTLTAAAILALKARRTGNKRPLLHLLVAVVLLNISVGTVKLATGRLGPRLTHHAHAVFAGGDIFPSGHTSNAVVIFGVLAAHAARHRLAAIAATAAAIAVGLATIFLDTHWLTDVIGGWLAGSLVLIATPPSIRPTRRLLDRLATRAARQRAPHHQPPPRSRSTHEVHQAPLMPCRRVNAARHRESTA